MQLDLIWEDVLNQIKPNISQQAFDTWLKPTALVSVNSYLRAQSVLWRVDS